jgi:uncharacterized repeat protein (TIGR03803 family)
MRTLANLTLTMGAAALFVGCGGSRPAVGVPGAMPQTRGIPRPASSIYRVLYRFRDQSDGNYPAARLIDAGGSLYGTTRFGGSDAGGVVYRIRTDGAQRVLHRFGGDGDGQNPTAGLVDVDGTLYGTTSAGGAGDGTVYRITTSGEEKVLYSFRGHPDGANPWAPLAKVNGTLYGTTDFGGAHRKGTVYSVNAKGVEKVLHSFGTPGDGEYPLAGLIDVNGMLYGTTRSGGDGCGAPHRCGTVYSITTSGEEKVFYSFRGADGAFPHAGLIDVNGTLYGTTYGGGAYGNGTVYSITTQGQEEVLHDFGAGDDGRLPYAGVIDLNGTLYGTTAAGGGSSKGCRIGSGCGTIYSVSVSGAEQVLHSFAGGSDGGYPVANLIHVKGTLYGTTASPEVYVYDGIPTVFALTPKLAHF